MAESTGPSGGAGVRPSQADQLFGKIALKNNLVSEADLRKALTELPAGIDLASYLVSKGNVSEKHATAIRRKVEERLRRLESSVGQGVVASSSKRTIHASAGLPRQSV